MKFFSRRFDFSGPFVWPFICHSSYNVLCEDHAATYFFSKNTTAPQTVPIPSPSNAGRRGTLWHATPVIRTGAFLDAGKYRLYKIKPLL
ncbi:hypothetical protein HDG32_003517 [Paraburkholderia sp. CI2]|uniref:hypothetical protein n=1 Tax=unclassified Paraburkholderia TaxID=2615204 RepID=UPI00161883E9|nr:hypothetical protein [Paraburkholderia sp. CI2]MBB5467394.1 hypothetical protein [Paraburkholderia sp. CI2]